MIRIKLDTFRVSEAKINHRFFQLSIFQLMNIKFMYQNCVGGGLLFYVNENIPDRKLTAAQANPSFELIFLKITLRT